MARQTCRTLLSGELVKKGRKRFFKDGKASVRGQEGKKKTGREKPISGLGTESTLSLRGKPWPRQSKGTQNFKGERLSRWGKTKEDILDHAEAKGTDIRFFSVDRGPCATWRK